MEIIIPYIKHDAMVYSNGIYVQDIRGIKKVAPPLRGCVNVHNDVITVLFGFARSPIVVKVPVTIAKIAGDSA